MKRILMIVAISIATNTFTQLSNTVPASGQVGIGTTSPEAGKQLTVSGNTIMLGDLELDNELIVRGEAILLDLVRMPTLTAFGGALDSFDILVTDMYGNVAKTDAKSLIAALMYDKPFEHVLCSDGDSLSPHWFSGTNKIYSYCPDVRVGIGTTAPHFQLDVRGITYTSKVLAGNLSGITPAVINAHADNSTDPIMHLGKKNGLATDGVRFQIDNNGAVTITNVGDQPSLTINNGTGHAIVIKDSDGSKIAQLNADGLLRSRSIRVDLGTWADYVFDKEYDLMSLKEIKKFIETNGHLPHVPKAAEIAENGLDLGEMQSIQMQKIEELTLHLIEMDERMAQMQAQMNALQTENETLKKELK